MAQLFGDGTETLRSTRLFFRKKKKVFYIDWKKNSEGEFLKVTEVGGGKRDTVVIPEHMIEAFIYAIAHVKGPPKGGE
jgi:hypothetical protein